MANGKEETMLVSYPENLNFNGKYLNRDQNKIEAMKPSKGVFLIKICSTFNFLYTILAISV